MNDHHRVLVRGGRVYEHDGDVHRPRSADVLIENGVIAAVGADLVADGCETIDASDRLIIPGLINAHYHSHDTLCRGLFEELPLEIWLLYTLPMGANRSKEEVRIRTLLGALECMRAGITTVQDMLGLSPLQEDYVDTVVSAYRQAGLRVVFSPMVWDVPAAAMIWRQGSLPDEVKDMLGSKAPNGPDQLAFLERQIERFRDAPILHWALAPFAPQRCTLEFLELCAEFSQRYDLPVYTHAYETKGQALIARERFAHHGGSFISYLQDAGLLTPRLNIVHSVWISRAEMERMAAADAGIVLNHMSNLKLKSGIAPVLDLRESGVRLGLGCDNCSGSDVQNIFQAMKLFCLFAAVSDPEPGPGLAHEALRHATLGNARTAGLGDRLGQIRPGHAADLVFLDLNDVAYAPFNSAARQIVYTETGRGVRDVMINGRMVVKDRVCLTIDEEALRREIKDLMHGFIEEFERVRRERAAALPYLVDAHREVWRADVGMNRFLSRAT